jgi:hypothetical protein
MAVIRITEYKNRDTISLLREALELAVDGKVTGVCLAMKFDQTHHGVALAGEYFDDPTDVLAVVSRIDFEVNMLVRERKNESQ